MELGQSIHRGAFLEVRGGEHSSLYESPMNGATGPMSLLSRKFHQALHELSCDCDGFPGQRIGRENIHASLAEVQSAGSEEKEPHLPFTGRAWTSFVPGSDLIDDGRCAVEQLVDQAV